MSQHTKQAAVLAACKLSALSLALFALPPVQAEGIFTLGTVVVQGDTESGAAQGEDVVSQKSMRQLNLYNVGEAVNTKAGVSRSGGGARNEQMIYVRGFDARQVPLFLDGIPQYVPYDGYVDFDRFTTFNLSEIRVAKGAASLLYGPNTLGGAVNLVTRRPTREVEGDVRLSYARGNQKMAAINLGTNQGLWYMQLGLSYLDADKYPLGKGFKDQKTVPTDTGKYRQNADYRDKNASFKVGFTPNETDEYVLGFAVLRGEKGNPVYTGDKNDRPRYWRWPYWNKESVYFLSTTAINADNDIKFRVYQDNYKNGLDMYTDETYTQHDPTSAYKDTTRGFSTEWVNRSIEHNEFHLAFHYKHDKHQDEDVLYKDRTLSLAAEDIIHIQDDWRLRVGVSHERRKSLAANNMPKAKGNATNGLVELAHDLNDQVEVYGSVAYKTRFPTIKNRYSARMGRAIPNPELKSENALHYELGTRTQPWQGAELEVAVFHSQVRDMIEMFSFPSNQCPKNSIIGMCDQERNVGKVRRQGLDLSFNQHWGEQWAGGLSYSYLHNKNQSNPAERIRDVPKHKLYAYVSWSPVHQLDLIASVDAETGRYYSYVDKKKDVYAQLPGFAVVNTKAVWSPREDLSFEAGVRNIANKNYAYKEGYPMPGRVWFAGATYRF